MSSLIKLMLVDDHEMVLQGLKALLETHNGIEVSATYTDGAEAIKNLQTVNPDIVVTDINMPTINGFDTAQGMLEIQSTLKIIMLSMEIKAAYIEKAKKEGIKGYVSKSAPIEDVVDAIKKVYQGDTCFSEPTTS